MKIASIVRGLIFVWAAIWLVEKPKALRVTTEALVAISVFGIFVKACKRVLLMITATIIKVRG